MNVALHKATRGQLAANLVILNRDEDDNSASPSPLHTNGWPMIFERFNANQPSPNKESSMALGLEPVILRPRVCDNNISQLQPLGSIRYVLTTQWLKDRFPTESSH
ncbi:hypothetical protein TNCV_3888231 [Trichonephila clavipes]|nr:hypothetical protein TNCV_3888231 [Trichonephila clavipes]